MGKKDPGIPTFSAFSDLDDDEVLPLVPFRLEGRLQHPLSNGELPDEVVAELGRWPELEPGRRRALIDEHGSAIVRTWSLELRAVPAAPSGVLDDLSRSVVIDEVTKQQQWNAVSLNRFMEGVIVDEDLPEWRRLVRDKERILPIDTLGRVVTYLAGELTNHPS